jgi:hypothetical protein
MRKQAQMLELIAQIRLYVISLHVVRHDEQTHAVHGAQSAFQLVAVLLPLELSAGRVEWIGELTVLYAVELDAELYFLIVRI